MTFNDTDTANSSASRYQQIADDYDRGCTQHELAKKYNISASAVQKIHHRVTGRKRLVGRVKGTLDHDAFSRDTPDASYWTGFLAADGYVNSGKNTISLTLHSKDHQHIVKYKDFLKSDLNIATYKSTDQKGCSRTISSLSVSSRKIKDALISRGVTPRKSLKYQVDEAFLADPDYWRGLIDGDGWITGDRIRVGLVGTQNVCVCFREFVRSLGIKADHKIMTQGKVYTLLVGGPAARATLDALYTDAPEHIRLERKYERAMQHLGRLH